MYYSISIFRCRVSLSTTFVEHAMAVNVLRGVAVLYKATREHSEECIPFSDAKTEANKLLTFWLLLMNLVQRLNRRAAASVGNPKAWVLFSQVVH